MHSNRKKHNENSFYMEIINQTKIFFENIFGNSIFLIKEPINNMDLNRRFELKYFFVKDKLNIIFETEQNSFSIGFINDKGEFGALRNECMYDDLLTKKNVFDAIKKLKKCLHNKEYELYYTDLAKIYYRRKNDKIIYFDTQKDFYNDIILHKNYK